MEKYLHKCLDSLIIDEEGMKQLEVLVINDGSKDSSSLIAHEYQATYPETFRVIDKENGNYGSCINRGLKEATGKYIKVLDADDTFDNENFQTYLSLLSSLDVDLVVTDYVIVNKEGMVKRKLGRNLKPNIMLSVSEVLEEFLNPQIQMHAVTYKTNNLRKINYIQTEGISYTDQEWMFMPMTTVNKVYYHPVVVYRYLVGRAGQTVEMDAHIRNIKHHIRKNEDLFAFYMKGEYSEEVCHYLETRLINSFYFVYYVCFFKIGNKSALLTLKKIDEDLKRSPQIYRMLDTKSVNKRLHYKFIHNWRSKGCPPKKSFLDYICTFALKLSSTINK